MDALPMPPVAPAVRYGSALATSALVLGAGVFYWLQNRPGAIGGPVSVPKAVWLVTTLYWWYAVPLLLLLDRRLPRTAHQVLLLAGAGLALRAVVELYMIYVAFNWSCYYGIAHDLATGTLFLWGAARTKADAGLGALMRLHFRVMAVMFAGEAYFAASFYLMIRRYQNEIYFVPEDWRRYWVILLPTTLLVVILGAYLVAFQRRWLGIPGPHPAGADSARRVVA